MKSWSERGKSPFSKKEEKVTAGLTGKVHIRESGGFQQIREGSATLQVREKEPRLHLSKGTNRGRTNSEVPHKKLNGRE